MDTLKLDASIEGMKKDLINAVQECVHINSVKSAPTPEAPYGPGPKEALMYALKCGEEFGFRTKNVDNRVGWIEYGEGTEMTAILAHLDVVPPGEGWHYDPFGGEIVGNRIYGRGSLDDKGPAMGALYGLRAIKECGLMPKRRIRVILGTDEESGFSCIRHYIDSGEEIPVTGFTPDATFPVIYFEKGMTNFTIGKQIHPADKSITLDGGLAGNVVMPECVLKVEGEDDLLVKGKTSHASRPATGINAGQLLFQQIKDRDLGPEFNMLKRFMLEKIGLETNGESLGIRYHDGETGETTVNLGIIHYGGDEIRMVFDIRYPRNADTSVIVQRVTDAAKEYGFEVLEASSHPMHYVPKDSPLVKTLMDVYCRETGTNIEPVAIGGGTYAKVFDNMVGFGALYPGDQAVAHRVDEYADIDKLILTTKIIMTGIYELANLPLNH